MKVMTETNQHDHRVAESALARRSSFAVVGAAGGLIGSMAGGAAFYTGPLGIILSMAAGAALLFVMGSHRR